MKIIKTPVKITLKEVEASEYYESRVMKNNNTSGKINAPKKWIGKEVYVLLKSNGDNDE